MAWIIMAQYVDDNGVEQHKPRFLVTTSEADALALSMRLNRAGSLTFMTAQYPIARRGVDHAQWMAAGLASLQAMDELAVPGTLYSVGQASEYTGPAESVLPVLGAMMTSFAQHSADPPATPHEAVFRLIRDAPPPPPPPPPPEPEPDPEP